MFKFFMVIFVVSLFTMLGLVAYKVVESWVGPLDAFDWAFLLSAGTVVFSALILTTITWRS